MKALIAALSESEKPLGTGWEQVPGGHGGFRKESGGKYQYWYPSKEAAGKSIAHHEGLKNEYGNKAAALPYKDAKAHYSQMAHHAGHSNGAYAVKNHGKTHDGGFSAVSSEKL